MKRDPSLIRELLIYIGDHQDGIQPLPMPVDEPVEEWLPDYDPPALPDGHSAENYVLGHLNQLIESGLAQGQVGRSFDSNTSLDRGMNEITWKEGIHDSYVTGLTPEGYDLLDSIADNSVWKGVKEKIENVGGRISIGVLQKLAVQAASKAVGL